MSSYHKLYTGLSRGIDDATAKKKICTYKWDYFYRDATGRLAQVSVYEDGFVYRSPALFRQQLNPDWPGTPGQKPAPPKYVEIPGQLLALPIGAVPCPAAEYEAALQRVLDYERKKKEEQAKEAEFAKSLKKGMARHAHASEEAGAAEVVALVPPVEAAPPAHFLDDFTVLDFETSDAYAIELAAVRVVNWQIVEQLQSFIQFRGRLNPFSAQLTGITAGQLYNAPPEKEVLQRFRKLAGGSLLVAHNASFDLRHLEAARTRQGATTPLSNAFLCTVVTAKTLLPAAPSHKLGDLCEQFGISPAGAHRALNDVLMTEQLLRVLHRQFTIPAALVGATSVAKARKKAAASPSLFAA